MRESPIEDPLASLERAFVDEFLRARGYDRESVAKLPKAAAQQIMAEAGEQASLLLAQIDCRAQLLRKLESDHSK